MSLRKTFVFTALAATLAMAAGDALARPGGGGSSGSRGSRTYSAPAPTQVAPRSAAPMERSVAPQAGPQSGLAQNAGRQGGFFSGAFGRGLLGGLVGAGLFGLLFGNGFMGGMGGLMSFLGLALQIGLLFLLARFAINFFRNRQAQPAAAGSRAGAPPRDPLQGAAYREAAGPATGGAAEPVSAKLEIAGDDYNTFEKRLGQIQTAYGAEDIGTLRRFSTPEMASYFEGELADNREKGFINKISDVKLVRGDLSEAWREPGAEYATVAMRYALRDAMVDRTTGRVVSGSTAAPEEVVEFWTFRRATGASPDGWALSAIQQAR